MIAGSSGGQGPAGDIKIHGNGSLTLQGTGQTLLSGINSAMVGANSVGDAGEILITMGNLTIADGAQINTSTDGIGNGGTIELITTHGITLNQGDITSSVERGAVGNGGAILITTPTLTLGNGGLISTTSNGQGNPGYIQITDNDNLIIDGSKANSNGTLSPSAIATLLLSQGKTQPTGSTEDFGFGEIWIETQNLTLTNGGAIAASNVGGRGDAGEITILAPTITLNGLLPDGSRGSAIESYTQIDPTNNRMPIGNAGNIYLYTDNLQVGKGGTISVSTQGRGNAGTITVNSLGLNPAQVDNFNQNVINLKAQIPNLDANAIVAPQAPQTLGQILNTYPSTFLTNVLNYQDQIPLFALNPTPQIQLDGGSMASNVELGGRGNAGNIILDVVDLRLINGGQINSSTQGRGFAGYVQVNDANTIHIMGKDSRITTAIGTQGNTLNLKGKNGAIDITTRTLTVQDQGLIAAFTRGQGNAGAIDVHATQGINLNHGSINSSVDRTGGGKGGDIFLETPSSPWSMVQKLMLVPLAPEMGAW
ncbi:MAG: hypothetical protein HC796_00830 [Synechococcaceae cyanobacterium RL_1_2]|nr:hypothetical protein [Synechococcaceae cyanobacterium RL_1_2]